jgi:hypothetical protein
MQYQQFIIPDTTQMYVSGVKAGEAYTISNNNVVTTITTVLGRK